jgi:hypothetical protein
VGLASPEDTPISDSHHVLRYVRRKHVDNGVVNGSGFLARPNEDAPSVNWMECFSLPIENQVSEITKRRRIKYEKRAQLVRLNVGHTREYVKKNSPVEIDLTFLHDPLSAEGDFCEDSSHAIIRGMPVLDTVEGEMIGDLLVDCIIERFHVDPD